MDPSRGRSRERSSSGGRAVRARSSRSRSMSVTRIPRTIGLKGEHKFTRSIQFAYQLNPSKGFVDNTGVTAGSFLAFTYTLTGVTVKGSSLAYSATFNMPNSSDFTNLFDHYRIDKVGIKMMSTVSGVGVQVTSNHQMPMIWIFNDIDDGLAPTQASQFLERENVRHISFSDTNVKDHTVYPRVAVQNYNGIALSGFGVGNKYAYMDAAYPNIEYYGTKFHYHSPVNTADLITGTLSYIVKYHLTFKGVI